MEKSLDSVTLRGYKTVIVEKCIRVASDIESSAAGRVFGPAFLLPPGGGGEAFVGNMRRGRNGQYLPASAPDSEVAAGGAPRPAAKRTGKRKPARRKSAPARPTRWPKEKEAIFFRELAIVCNVSAALRTAGLLRRSRDVYDRRSDTAFRARWEEALAESRVLMSLELHERARFGDNRPAPANEIEAKLRAVPTGLAMQLLKLYEGRAAKVAAAAQPVRRRDPERRRALRRELMERLAEFNRRMGGDGS